MNLSHEEFIEAWNEYVDTPNRDCSTIEAFTAGWEAANAKVAKQASREGAVEPSPRSLVYAAIDSERAYQIEMAAKIYDNPFSDENKPLEAFVLYMEDYLHECRSQLSRTWGMQANELALNTLRKVVAIGVSAMEAHGAPQRTAPTKHAHGMDIA